MRLWRVDLQHAEAAGRFLCLTPEEHERANRFYFEHGRRRFRAARSALRVLLGMQLGIAPEALQLDTGEYGKPFVVQAPGCEFNLSHSDELALVGIATDGRVTGGIGVDVEVTRTLSDAEALAVRHFSADELAAVRAGDSVGRNQAFLRVWTRKEACIKAVGSGLSIAPETFEAGAERGRREARLVLAGRAMSVEVQSLPLAKDEFAAVARVLA